jgi:PKD repeat protein
MSEPGDELTPLPESPDDKPRLSRSPYVALGVAALVVSTVFATVAALASTREDQAAPSPESHDTVESTSDTYTTDPTATSAPSSSKGTPSKKSTTTTTTSDETTTEDETTGNVTTPGQTTTPRPTTTTPPPPANKAPDAEFNVSCENLACDFDGGSSADPDGSIVSYSWSFGAGGQTAQHTFDAPGTFDVTLTVKDDKGKSDSVTKPVTVSAPTATSGN